MSSYVTYDESGRILGIHEAPEVPEGEFVLEVAPEQVSVDHYVDVTTTPHESKPKLAQPIQRVGDTLSGIPLPATLETALGEFEVINETIELAFDEPGTYRVTIRPDDPKYPVWAGVVTTE